MADAMAGPMDPRRHNKPMNEHEKKKIAGTAVTIQEQEYHRITKSKPYNAATKTKDPTMPERKRKISATKAISDCRVNHMRATRNVAEGEEQTDETNQSSPSWCRS